MRIAYFSDATSIYDDFFLTKLSESFEVSLLTFNKRPRATRGVQTFILPEILGKLPGHDSPRIYSTMPLKTVLLKTWLGNAAPDVLIGCGLDYGLASALSGFRPFISFIWGSEVLVLPRRLPFRAMVRYVLARADGIVLDSDIQFEACVKLGCNPSKIVKVPWVDSSELARSYREIEMRREQFRNMFGWSEDDVIVICTRSHTPIYDVPCVMNSVPLVLKHCKKARFLFVGKGPLTANLKNLADRLGVGRNVHFTGYLGHPELLACLKNSDIYVSSSLSDGTSASLIEAMVSKLPCVVSDIPGNREWVTDNENGLLFPPKDCGSLAKLLVELIRDDRLRAKLGEAGYQTSSTKGNWERNSNELISVIQTLGSHVR